MPTPEEFMTRATFDDVIRNALSRRQLLGDVGVYVHTQFGAPMSGWPAGYQTTVINGHCDKCGQFRRVRQFAFDVNDNHVLEWLCKSCAKQPPKDESK